MDINWKAVETMTPEDIENVRVEVIKEIQTIRDARALAVDEQNEVKRQIIQLEAQRHELRTQIQKANSNIAKRQSDIDVLTTRFWQKRR